MARITFLIIVLTAAARVAWGSPGPTTAFLIEGATLARNVMIEMRDGVRLAADILLPDGEGPFPVILWRTPYGKEGAIREGGEGEGWDYAQAGFAAVAQDCRGRNQSEGVWDPFKNEARDGADTLEWIGNQPWCNGKIGLTGGSYLGFTQCVNAPNGSPYLASMNPIVPWGNTYHDVMYWGGAFRLQLLTFWGALQFFAETGVPVPEGIAKGEFFETLPVNRWDQGVKVKIHYLRDWASHPTHDRFWKEYEVGDKIEDVAIPALYIGGWYDIFQNGVINYWNGVRTRSKSMEARKRQHLIMGPWGHGVSPKDGKVGDLSFGEGSNIQPKELRMKWFQETLLGMDRGFSGQPPLRLFVMGKNIWRDENEWPLARTTYRKLFLSAGEPANSAAGGGVLSWELEEDGREFDTYLYDPNDPVPTQGGSLLWPTAGPRDQTEVEARADVLVYTSEVLDETLEATGPIRLVLYAASTAPDTDFTGKLVDVHPGEDGEERPYNVTDGILRARFRESDTEPRLIEPGKAYEYDIDLGYTSIAFLPGHRIRLEVSSSNFPRFDRNPNTGHPFGADDALLSATQTIYHAETFPSHLALPVIEE